MTLYDQIKEQADTIEMLSGQRPVGIRLTEGDLLHLLLETNQMLEFSYEYIGGIPYVHGLRIEVID